MKRLAVLLCLAGLLAACGSGKDSGPVSLPPVSATAGQTSPAPSTTASAVPKPADADAFTSQGAASFVRYYIDVINEAVNDNDLRQITQLSAPECEGCQNYISSIQSTIAERGRVESGRLSVLYAVAPAIADGETTVLLDFTASEYVSRGENGQELHRFPSVGRTTAELRCVRSGDHWIVMGFRLAPVGGT